MHENTARLSPDAIIGFSITRSRDNSGGRYVGNLPAAGQLRPLRHHIYRGAVVGVRGAAVGARGAVVGVRGAAVGNIGMHSYKRHICAPGQP